MNKRLKNILIIAGILIVILLVWLLFFHKKETQVTVQAEKPTKGYIAESVTATGKIEPEDTVSVGAQVSGQIKYVYADFNSTVKKGQKIAELDKDLLTATLNQAKGDLLNAESQLIFQENNFNRQNLLYKTDAISKADYDSAVNTLNAAKAQVKSSKAGVASAQKNLSFADIYSPIDGVVLNRAISVGQTVASSFSTPTLFIIAKDVTKMQVQANVDEADIGNVKAGNRASFTVDAFINDQFGGTVSEIRLHPTVTSNVTTYTTIINAPNNDLKLKPGMTASIIIYTKEVNNAMLIPAKALTFVPDSTLLKNYQIVGKVGRKHAGGHHGGTSGTLPGGNTVTGGDNQAQMSHSAKSRKDTGGVSKQEATVWVLNGKQIVKKRITIGLNDNTHVEVLSGLTADDQVITGTTGGPNSANATAAAPGASPFLPQRRAGGGGGGGGGRGR